MPLSIVLVHPDIPQNTGNIARLTAANDVQLHIIEPMGFKISDRHLKRAGLDYWPHVRLTIHASWEAYRTAAGVERSRLWFFTTHVERTLYDVSFSPDDVLVFGSESAGLPNRYHEEYADRRLTIPMKNRNVRSLNLSSSAAIALYEAERQVRVAAQKDPAG